MPHSWCSREAIDPARPRRSCRPVHAGLGGSADRASPRTCAARGHARPRGLRFGLFEPGSARRRSVIVAMHSADPTRCIVLLLDALTRAVPRLLGRRDDKRPHFRRRRSRSRCKDGVCARYLHRHFGEPVSVRAPASLACISISDCATTIRMTTRHPNCRCPSDLHGLFRR